MPIDWHAYIPPQKLPDTGPKNLAKGEIWAFNMGGAAGVIRILTTVLVGDYTTLTEHELLAGNFCFESSPGRCLFYPEGRAKYALLVTSDGTEPPDPDLLFQFLYK